MRRKVLSILLVVLIILSTYILPVFAGTQASDYFNAYYYNLSQGSRPGRISLYFSVTATTNMLQLGASEIKMYRANGTLYWTMTGSTSNGLMTTNAVHHSCSKYIDCSSGSTYYFEITYKAKNSSGAEYKTITTSTIQAP